MSEQQEKDVSPNMSQPDTQVKSFPLFTLL